MCNFENTLHFFHFSIDLDMSRITHLLADIMNPKISASGNFLTFSMSVTAQLVYFIPILQYHLQYSIGCINMSSFIQTFPFSKQLELSNKNRLKIYQI